MADAEEVIDSYRSSLADLTINSKPLISMLTMLAEDHIQYAQHIVQLIEQHLQKVKPSQKLPVLYLIDSIIKNLDECEYPQLFSKNIVSIFCDTFEKVDEKTRGAMYKLRQTWQMYFPNQKLYALDMRVNMLDPAWPIIADPPGQGNIHVNPRFLVQKEEERKPVEQPETLMRKQLIAKQQELLGILQQQVDHDSTEPSANSPDSINKHQDDDLSVISDSSHAVKASSVLSLPSIVPNNSTSRQFINSDTIPTFLSNSQVSKKTKLPLPKIDLDVSQAPKANDRQDNTSLIQTTPSVTLSAKARDPRLFRHSRLASRDPRIQTISRKTKEESINTGKADDKESTNAPALSHNILSNIRSLDAVMSHSHANPVSGDAHGLEITPKITYDDSNSIEKNTLLPKGEIEITKEQVFLPSLSCDSEVGHPTTSISSSSVPDRPISKTSSGNFMELSIIEESKLSSEGSSMNVTPQTSNTVTALIDLNSSKLGEESVDLTNKPMQFSGDYLKTDACMPSKTLSEEDKHSDKIRSSSRDRQKTSDDGDKSRRRDDRENLRDHGRHSRDFRGSRRGERREDDARRFGDKDEDRRNRHREDEYRDRNTDRFGRERRSKDRFSSRYRDRYDDDDHERSRWRRGRDRSPFKRSPESSGARNWHQEERKYKDQRSDIWKNSGDGHLSHNENDQMSSKGNQIRRSPNHSKSVSSNSRHDSSGPKESLNGKSSDEKNLKRDRDYREVSLINAQSECDLSGPSSQKQIRSDPGIDVSEASSTKEDLSDLFGNEDQDYRVPGRMSDHHIPYMRSGSHSGWAKFKADHPDNFVDENDTSATPMDIDERYKDVDMRWNSGQRPNCLQNTLKSPYSGRVLDSATRNEHANLIRGAAKLAQSGELSHEEHQLVLKQIGNLQNMNYDKSSKDLDHYEDGQSFDQRSHDVKNYHVHDQIKSSKWMSELSPEINPHSPQRDPSRLFLSNHHQDADMRNQVEMPPSNVPLSNHPHPVHSNNAPWGPAALMQSDLIDPRWKGNAVVMDSEMSEVVIDHKPYEVVLNGKRRKLRLHGKVFEMFADGRERAISINNHVYYRFGEDVKDVQIDGRWHRIHYQGQPKNIWVDGQRFEVRVDAPPRRIVLNKIEHFLHIDGRDMMIFIDRVKQGIYGGPPRSIFINNICHEIRFDPPARQILIDGKPCELKLNHRIPFVVLDCKPHGIRFDGPDREIIIDDTPYMVPVDKPIKIRLGKRPHFLAFGGPAHEVIIDGKWFEVRFDSPPVEIHLGNRTHSVMLKGASPTVKILGELPVTPEPNRPHFNFGNSNMFTQAPPLVNNFNRPRMPDNFQPRPPHWDITFERRQNQPDAMTMIRPSHFPPERPLENLRFPGMPPIIGSTSLPGPGLMNSGQPPFYPNMTAVALPPLSTLPPGLGPVPTTAPPHHQFPQITFTTAGFVGNISTPAISSIPVTQTAPAPANIVSNTVPAPPLTVNAPTLLPGLTSLPSALNKIVPPPNNLLTVNQPQTVTQPIDVASLFQKLVSAGIIPNSTAKKEKEKEEPPEKEKESEPEIVPDLADFKTAKLKVKYVQFINEIYDGIQCSSCGIRFTVDDTEKYREHLDWHFRQNKKEKDDYKVAKYRKWYYEINEWIQYEEIQDDEEKHRSNFFENMLNSVQEPSFVGAQGNKVLQCPAATGNDTDDVCDICSDPFEQFWNEDEEEWHLRNAIRVEGKTYHPVCYEDVKENIEQTSADVSLDTPEKNPLEEELSSSAPKTVAATTESTTSETPSSTTVTAATTSVKSEDSSETSVGSTTASVEVTTAVVSSTNTATTLDSNITAQPITTIVSSSGLKQSSL